MRAALLALLAALTLAAAGCGSEDVGAGQSGAAELLKAGALVYWESDVNPDSDQWKQVEELVRRFPDGEKWLAELRKSFEDDTEITWAEAKEALGDEVAVAVYATSLTDVNVVGLLNPDDPDKTIELVKRANEESDDPSEELVTRKVDDWLVLSDKETSIDAALKGDDGEALADVQRFQDGLAELPDDALSRVYVDVGAALDKFGAAQPEMAKSFRMLGLDEIDFAGAWAKARDDGAEAAGVLRGEGADKLLGAAEPYASTLLDRVPADAFAFATFQGRGATEQFQSLRDNPLYGLALREFEQEVGIELEDLVALFKGEVAFYVAPGAPIPELTLLLDPDNPAQARDTAARMLGTLAERGGGTVTEDGDVTTATFTGVSVHLGLAGDALVISTARAALQAGDVAEKLADTDRYSQALESAGAPDEYTGLLYVDLAEAIEVVMGFAGASGETVPPEIARNLEPLRSLVAYGKKDGDLASSLLFVEIQ
jgi:hypothetical protein